MHINIFLICSGPKLQSNCRLVVLWRVVVRDADWAESVQWMWWGWAVLVHLQWNTLDPWLSVQGGDQHCEGCKCEIGVFADGELWLTFSRFQLLEKDASIRLGGALSPFGDIVDHRFFNTMNWQKLEHRELDPPFKPAVVSVPLKCPFLASYLTLLLSFQRHPLDTQYFDQTFTKERVRLTPIMKEILHSMDQEQFQGFSYTNPNATLTWWCCSLAPEGNSCSAH